MHKLNKVMVLALAILCGAPFSVRADIGPLKADGLTSYGDVNVAGNIAASGTLMASGSVYVTGQQIALGSDITVNGDGSAGIGLSNTVGSDRGYVLGYDNTMTGGSDGAILGKGNTVTNIVGGGMNIAVGNSIDIGGGTNNVVIGDTITTSDRSSTYALGRWISNTQSSVTTIGSGFDVLNPLVNGVVDSIMLGSGSNLPTMTITTASATGAIGKVGIGTTLPSDEFEVVGDSKFTGVVDIDANDAIDYAIDVTQDGNGGGLTIDNDGTGYGVWVDGTNSSNSALYVTGANTTAVAYTAYIFDSIATNKGGAFHVTDNENNLFYPSAWIENRSATADSTAMRIHCDYRGTGCQELDLWNDLNTAAGPQLTFLKRRNAGTIGVLGDNVLEIYGNGYDDANNLESYVSITGVIHEEADGEEDGKLIFSAMSDGTSTSLLEVRGLNGDVYMPGGLIVEGTFEDRRVLPISGTPGPANSPSTAFASATVYEDFSEGDYLGYQFTIPTNYASGDIELEFTMINGSAAAGTSQWQVAYHCYDNGDQIGVDSYDGGVVSAIQTSSTSQYDTWEMEIGIPSVDVSAHEYCAFKFTRLAIAGTDGDHGIANVDIHYNAYFIGRE